MKVSQELIKLVEKLPPELQREVQDFVEFLIKKYEIDQKISKKRKLSLSWKGALREMRDQYTSVELQHKILEMWGD